MLGGRVVEDVVEPGVRAAAVLEQQDARVGVGVVEVGGEVEEEGVRVGGGAEAHCLEDGGVFSVGVGVG